MRFLVDECIGPSVANWLRAQGHDAVSVYEDGRGSTDPALLERANREERILITNDKDFGERVFRDRLPHHGIVLLRLRNERTANKIEGLRSLLEQYAEQLCGRFAVVTEAGIRIVGLTSETGDN